MKTLFDILKTSFLTVSAIIGAGFITGRELVGYFGTQNFEVYAVLSGILFFGCFYIVYSFGAKHSDYGELHIRMLGEKGGKVMSGAVIVSAFVSLCSLFAAMDALSDSLGLFGGFPVLSIIAIVVVSFTSKYGISGLEKINSVLVPIVLSAIISALCFKGDFKLDFDFAFSGAKSGKTILYVTMNVFINLPIIFSSANGRSKKSVIISAVVSALILSGLTFFMLGAIAYGGSGAENADMPLLVAVGGGYSLAFAIALFFAIASSVTTAYYPLYEFAVKTDGKRGIVLLGVFAFAFSRFGLKNIVDYVYPVIGGFGAVYMVCNIIFMIRCKNKKVGIKRRAVADNNRIISKGEKL